MRGMKIFAAVLAVSTAYAVFGEEPTTPTQSPTLTVTDVRVPAEGYGSDAIEQGTLYVTQIVPQTSEAEFVLFVAVPDESPEGGYPEHVYEDGTTIYTDGWILIPNGPNGPTWEPPTFDPTHSDIELGA